jgi:hypothetical protein
VGPLHPLPVPDKRFHTVAIDFVGPLPEEQGYNHILTMTDQLGADVWLVACKKNLTTRELANIFFDNWFCENGLPKEIVSDRDVLFLSKFWGHLHELTRIKLKMSSAFHPQTDGLSEHTNKTLNQSLCLALQTRQHSWATALPKIRFQIMNSVNASTGYSSFQLCLGCSPRLIPPISKEPLDNNAETPTQLLECIAHDVGTAADNLLESKVLQAAQSNKYRNPNILYAIGDKVLLSTKNLHNDALLEIFSSTRRLQPTYCISVLLQSLQ